MFRALSTRGGLPALGLLLLSLPLLSGCGKASGKVTGKVTYKGEPLTSGAVTFHGEDGRVDSASIDPQGNYTMARAPAGTVKVTVVTTKPPPAEATPAQGPGSKAVAHPGGPGKGAPAGKYVQIPPKYGDPERSGLTYEVTGGSQTINITLE